MNNFRLILFRIWDEQNQEWLGESDDNVCPWKNFSLRGEIMAMQDFPTPDILDHCVIEQWSGTMDKNGEDIYEGDILRGKFRNYVVHFMDYYGGFVAQNVVDEDFFLLNHHNAKHVEVIGNIHENPEKNPEVETGDGDEY